MVGVVEGASPAVRRCLAGMNLVVGVVEGASLEVVELLVVGAPRNSHPAPSSRYRPPAR